MVDLAEELDVVANNLMFTSFLIENNKLKFLAEDEKEEIKSLLTTELPSARILRLKGFPYSIFDLDETQLNDYNDDVKEELIGLKKRLADASNKLYEKRVMTGVLKRRSRK